MSAQKPGLHPRNRHHSRYDLATLCQVNPELRQFLTLTPAGTVSATGASNLSDLEDKLAEKAREQGAKGYVINSAGGNDQMFGTATIYK